MKVSEISSLEIPEIVAENSMDSIKLLI